jgi:hypothetical protein
MRRHPEERLVAAASIGLAMGRRHPRITSRIGHDQGLASRGDEPGETLAYLQARGGHRLPRVAIGTREHQVVLLSDPNPDGSRNRAGAHDAFGQSSANSDSRGWNLESSRLVSSSRSSRSRCDSDNRKGSGADPVALRLNSPSFPWADTDAPVHRRRRTSAVQVVGQHTRRGPHQESCWDLSRKFPERQK